MTKHIKINIILVILFSVLSVNRINAKEHKKNVFISICDSVITYKIGGKKRIKLLIFNGTDDTLKVPEYFTKSKRNGIGDIIYDIEKLDTISGEYIPVEHKNILITFDYNTEFYNVEPKDFIVVDESFGVFYDLKEPGDYRIRATWQRYIIPEKWRCSWFYVLIGKVKKLKEDIDTTSPWRKFIIEK
jgi:hypothetical protein